jgi:hypothetical protein
MKSDDQRFENELQEMIHSAEDTFGKEFFERIEKLTQEESPDSEENYVKYILKTTNKGAFYACEE